MTDDLKLHKDAERGAQAEALLESALVKEAFDRLERSYFEAWRDPTVIAGSDVAGRERLWQAAQIVGKVRTHLSIVARDGRVAIAELQNLAQGGK